MRSIVMLVALAIAGPAYGQGWDPYELDYDPGLYRELQRSRALDQLSRSIDSSMHTYTFERNSFGETPVLSTPWGQTWSCQTIGFATTCR